MLSKTMIDKLNKQMNLEFFSSNLYLQMAAWAESKGYAGSGSFLKVHAAEEMEHMNKLFTYILETGNLPILGSIAAPEPEYNSLKDLFEKILKHEEEVTSGINDLVATAFDEKDFSSFNFLQWYVGEQHEEENLFHSILDKIDIIGTEGRGLYLIDKEIGKMAIAAPAAPAT